MKLTSTPKTRKGATAGTEEGWDKIEMFLQQISDDATPKTHCCECTPGEHFQPHYVHIQYKGCKCDPKVYVLRKNEGE